jgi:T-complex protein 1 subunit theta
MEEIIEGIAASGAKVVIANGSISELALHYLDKFGLMVLKIQSKFELRRICGALGEVNRDHFITIHISFYLLYLSI